jgi:flagellar FliL protein
MPAEKKETVETDQPGETQPKKGNKKLLFIVIGVVLVLLVGGGAAGYMFLADGKQKGSAGQEKEKSSKGKAVLFALDPFVLNLAEQGRFLKVSMQLELTDDSALASANERTPQLRDAFITLVSSKSADSLANPEGKFQLKDELLLRANQAIGKDVVRNLYFTEFIMQ